MSTRHSDVTVVGDNVPTSVAAALPGVADGPVDPEGPSPDVTAVAQPKPGGDWQGLLAFHHRPIGAGGCMSQRAGGGPRTRDLRTPFGPGPVIGPESLKNT